MQHVPTGRVKPLTPAFASKLRRGILLLAAFAVIAFGVMTDRLLRLQARQALTEQARFVAAAIVPGVNGDLSESVVRLQDRCDQLIAVATLGSYGNPHSVYPERPAHRMAVRAVLNGGDAPIRMPAPSDGETVTVSGVTVPLNGSFSPDAQQVVILLRHDSYRADWIRATTLFALLTGTMALSCVRAMRWWFDRRVAHPLRTMAQAAQDPLRDPDEMPMLEPGRYRETVLLAEQLQELLRAAAEGDARVRRVARRAQQQFHERELGFDRQLRRAKDRATLDPLTRLRNRAFIEDELGPLFERQRAADQDLAAVMIDVDNFKRYNDAHGHQAGDALLRFIGALLQGAVRPTDHAVRYGGDEFLLLLLDTSAEQAAAVAERLVKLFGQYTKRLGRKYRLSISAGVASLSDDQPESGDALVARADAALYAAKRKGKNTVVCGRAAWKSAIAGT